MPLVEKRFYLFGVWPNVTVWPLAMRGTSSNNIWYQANTQVIIKTITCSSPCYHMLIDQWSLATYPLQESKLVSSSVGELTQVNYITDPPPIWQFSGLVIDHSSPSTVTHGRSYAPPNLETPLHQYNQARAVREQEGDEIAWMNNYTSPSWGSALLGSTVTLSIKGK